MPEEARGPGFPADAKETLVYRQHNCSPGGEVTFWHLRGAGHTPAIWDTNDAGVHFALSAHMLLWLFQQRAGPRSASSLGGNLQPFLTSLVSGVRRPRAAHRRRGAAAVVSVLLGLWLRFS